MRRALILAMAAGGLLAPAASGALAASPASATGITIGQTLRGTLTTSDGKWTDGTYYDRFRFRAEAGTWVTIDMISSEFDTYLHLAKAGESGRIEYDDDAGDSNNARINAFIPVTGDYDIIANGVNDDDLGPYSVRLTRDEPGAHPASRMRTGGSQPATARTINLGQTIQATLRDNDPIDQHGEPYQLFKMPMTVGRLYTIEMKSSAFDSQLILRHAGEVGAVDDDDDSGDGNNDAKIEFEPDVSGDYEIVATRAMSTGVGAYSISVSDKPASSSSDEDEDGVKVTPIAYGSEIRGALESGDNLDDEALWYDSYRFAGRVGDRIVITVDATGFDPMIELFDPDDDFVADDDDGGQGLNSRLEYTIKDTGVHFIDVLPADDDDTGTYTLKLTRQ